MNNIIAKNRDYEFLKEEFYSKETKEYISYNKIKSITRIFFGQVFKIEYIDSKNKLKVAEIFISVKDRGNIINYLKSIGFKSSFRKKTFIENSKFWISLSVCITIINFLAIALPISSENHRVSILIMPFLYLANLLSIYDLVIINIGVYILSIVCICINVLKKKQLEVLKKDYFEY